MGTIVARPRKDGSLSYTAQIKIKRGGRVVFSQAQTFDKESTARKWMDRKEKDLSAPDALDAAKRPTGTLADAIDKYVKESRKEIGRTKAQVLNSIKLYEITEMDCAEIRPMDIVTFANQLGRDRQPQTVGNYLSHLAGVFRVARAAWGMRHEGASRLFEMGKTIPEVATFTGHRSWQSLQRYSHLRQTGDKFLGWPWIAKLSTKAKGF